MRTPKYNIEYVKQRYASNPATCNIIGFWKTFQAYGYCCQWYKTNFTDGEIVFSCTEQYMMYKKALLFNDTQIAQKILNETEPAAMKELGREIKFFNANIWDANKYDIVYQANYLKFSQNPLLANKLKTTGSAILAEMSPYDTIWGIGMPSNNKRAFNPNNWRSEAQNLLGFALMEVRDNLK